MKTKSDIPPMTCEEKEKGIEEFINKAKDTQMNTIENPKSNHSINPSTIINSSTDYKKIKYTDTRKQRAFYYDSDLIGIFDKHFPKEKFDKSKIMNDQLKKYLIEEKLIKENENE